MRLSLIGMGAVLLLCVLVVVHHRRMRVAEARRRDLAADVRDRMPERLPLVAFTGDPLGSWRAALGRTCRSQAVSVYVVGTSRSIVDRTVSPMAEDGRAVTSTFPRRWVNQIRQSLFQLCPSHGSGMVGLRWGTGDFAAQGVNGDYFKVPPGVTARPYAGRWGPFQNKYAPDGQLLLRDPVTLEFTTSSPQGVDFLYNGSWDRLRMYCLRGPALHAFTLQIDGKEAGTCGGYAATEQAALGVSRVVRSGRHRASFVCRQAPCAGAYLEAVQGKSGMSVSDLAVAGASAEMFAEFPSTQFAYSDLDPDPERLVIVEEGCNEPGMGDTPERFRTTMLNLIAHFRARPLQPSILLLADLQDKLLDQEAEYDVLKQVAGSQHTAYLDLRDGAPAPATALFGPDGVHENDAGQDFIAHAVRKELLLPEAHAGR